MAVFKLLGAQLLLRRSSGLSDSNSLQQLRLVGPRPLARARSVAPSRQPAARSASTSRLPYQRMLRGLFRTNLLALGGSGSSGLINLLVFQLAASAVSGCPSLLNQGPLRASNAVPAPNYFLLRPTAFHHTWLHRSGGYALSGLIGESALFCSDLRAVDFLLFFADIARLLVSLPTQGRSAIRRPNVSSMAKPTDRRHGWTYARKTPVALDGSARGR
jgi:hypothetical protein